MFWSLITKSNPSVTQSCSDGDGIITSAGIDADFVLQPADTTAVIGQDALIDCLSPPSTPPAAITWSRDSSLLSAPRYQVLQNGSLLVMEVELSDQTTYYCTATNPLLGTSRVSQGAVLTTIGTFHANEGAVWLRVWFC